MSYSSDPLALVNELQTEPAMGETIRDEFFYFENIVVQVENTLYRVPKQVLTIKGTTFYDMFSLPVASEQNPVEGSCDSCPIVLEGIFSNDFRAFLKVLYPFSNDVPLTRKEWIGVLDLATMWVFTEIRIRAIENLSTMIQSDAYSKILLGKKYKVKSWLLEGYIALVKPRNEPPISLSDFSQNGIDDWTIARLYYVQILWINSNFGSSSYQCYSCHRTCACNQGVRGLDPGQIETVFAEEFATM